MTIYTVLKYNQLLDHDDTPKRILILTGDGKSTLSYPTRSLVECPTNTSTTITNSP